MPRVFLLAALAVCLLFSQVSTAAEPAPAAKQPVEVKFWVVEVSTTKLRNLGFDWQALEKNPNTDDPSKQLGFFLALEQNNLARILAKPMIATVSGRQATLAIEPALKVEVTPTVVDGQTIALDYRLERDIPVQAGSPETKGRFVTASATEVASGKVTLLSETNCQERRTDGKPNDTKLLVFAQATIGK